LESSLGLEAILLHSSEKVNPTFSIDDSIEYSNHIEKRISMLSTKRTQDPIDWIEAENCYLRERLAGLNISPNKDNILIIKIKKPLSLKDLLE